MQINFISSFFAAEKTRKIIMQQKGKLNNNEKPKIYSSFGSMFS